MIPQDIIFAVTYGALIISIGLCILGHVINSRQAKTIDNLYSDIQLLEIREMRLKDELKDVKLELEIV